MIDVVLAEDEALLRSGLRLLLEFEGDIAVVAEAGDGEAALRAVQRHRPDVLLIDLQMPRVGGIEAIRRLRADPQGLDCRSLVLTTFDDDDDVLAALRAGADGYLLKDVQPDALRQAVRAVVNGEPVLASRALSAVLHIVSAVRPARGDLLVGFSDREIDVLREVGKGLSNAEIAQRLHLSPATVRTYVSRMLVRRGLRDRAQLVVLAYESGLQERGGDTAST